MSPDSCFSSCPCGGVFVTGQNHDTGKLSAWHKVPSVMHYEIPDCFVAFKFHQEGIATPRAQAFQAYQRGVADGIFEVRVIHAVT